MIGGRCSSGLLQGLGRLRTGIVASAGRVDETLENMVLDHLGNEAVERPAASGSLLQGGRAACVLLDAPFDSVELTPDAPHGRGRMPTSSILLVTHNIGEAVLMSACWS